MDLWGLPEWNKDQLFTDQASQQTTHSSNRSTEPFRDECLNVHWFQTLAEAKQLIESWRREYNTRSRPLAGLSMKGHQANSPVSTRLAVHLLQPKPAED